MQAVSNTSQKKEALAKEPQCASKYTCTSACTYALVLSNFPILSHLHPPVFTAHIKVQFSCRAQVILDLHCKTTFKGVNVMEPFGPVQEEWGKGSVSQIDCIVISIREPLYNFCSSSHSWFSHSRRIIWLTVVKSDVISYDILMGICVPPWGRNNTKYPEIPSEIAFDLKMKTLRGSISVKSFRFSCDLMKRLQFSKSATSHFKLTQLKCRPGILTPGITMKLQIKSVS